MKKRLIAAAGIFALLLAMLCVPLAAASVEYRDVAITVVLEEDGSALITEVWDMSAQEGTEMYLIRNNFDEQTLTDFKVYENGRQLEDIGEWDVDAGFDEKAGKYGTVPSGDGYELCWGLGSYGDHVFTVEYRLTNVVKHYNDAEVIFQVFAPDFTADIGHVSITIEAPGQNFVTENTGVWAGGTTGEIFVQGGRVEAETTAGMPQGDYFSVLVQFAEGMFAPGVSRDEDFETLKERVLAGSSYVQEKPGEAGYDDGGYDDDYDYNVTGWDRFLWSIGDVLQLVFPMLFVGAIGFIFIKLFRGGGSSSSGTRAMRPEYRDVEYSRELPWGGSLPATYSRLEELRQLENEGVVIGAYLLRWVRSKQVELVKHQGGIFQNKEEDAIKLYAARDGMDGTERALYDMLVAAAGSDYILQSKEFEKWSRKHYERVQGWLERYKNQGKAAMREMGATETVQAKAFFGLVNTTQTRMSATGEKLTREMFGFKKYLSDFTIINEREAREVQLWDEYLVFAQVFGIADEVAKQFQELYPDYFANMARELGYSNMTYFDFYMINRITRNYARAAATGYRAGYNAAQSSGWSGGGGGFSGGGGGFSGGSGGGGGGGGVR